MIGEGGGYPLKKVLSGVGFEPTPSYEDQNTQLSVQKQGILESGALDHSANLTYEFQTII